MSKIFIIDTYYGDFLKEFYAENPILAKSNYAVQKKALLEKKFGTADFYSNAFNKLGHEAEEFIINAEILQKQWAKENYVKYREAKFKKIPKIRALFKSNWLKKILEAQIKTFKPDIIYVLDINYSIPEIFISAKKSFGTKIVGQIASLLPPKELFSSYDLLISSLPHYVKQFEQWGKRSAYIPLSFEPTILEKIKTSKTQYNITHVGGYGPIHNERNELLEKTAQILEKHNIKIDFWGYGTENLGPDSIILKNFHGPAWGLDMYNILYGSKITLTKHIQKVAGKYANNMTLFEATGCGTLLITDFKENLSDLFVIHKEIEIYNTANELAEKIIYYLSNEDLRLTIAKAGQTRTIREHNYLNRIEKLMNIIKTI